MSTDTKRKPLTEEEIDALVVAQADDDSVWEEPVRVTAAKSAPLSLPPELLSRARFLAQIHRKASVEDWLVGVIRDRVDLEEAAFTGLKRDLAKQTA